MLTCAGRGLLQSQRRGAHELRVRDGAGAYRVFYCVRLAHGILIFHAFTKKTQATPSRELELAKRRLKDALDIEA